MYRTLIAPTEAPRRVSSAVFLSRTGVSCDARDSPVMRMTAQRLGIWQRGSPAECIADRGVPCQREWRHAPEHRSQEPDLMRARPSIKTAARTRGRRK